MDVLRSEPHTVSSKAFGRIAAEQFVRRYWPWYAASVVFGIVLIVVVRDQFATILGLLFTTYPIIAPIRYAGVAAARAKSFTNVEMTYEIDDDEIIVRSSEGGVTRGQLKNVVRVDSVKDHLFMQFGKATYVIVPLEAFASGDRLEAAKRIREGMLKGRPA